MSEETLPQEGQRGYSAVRRFPRTYFETKPVKIGEELDVTISEVSHKGDGLTRVQGYVIFVPQTRKGDSVRIKVTQIRPNFAVGEVIAQK